MKIAHIVGARPQFIKYFPVSSAIESFQRTSGGRIEDILVHTGQHYDYTMSEIFFKEMGIKEPTYYLNIGSGSHGLQTGQILLKVEEVLLKERPDIVVVYGDTNSTLGGALAAAKLHIPVAHIEAGLRSYNKYMPEEINRVLTDHASSLLLCPTKAAVENLGREGFGRIVDRGNLIAANFELPFSKADMNNPIVMNVGDVMYDVILIALKAAAKKSKILETLHLGGKRYAVLTLHRAENTDDSRRLEGIIDFVNDWSGGVDVVFPVHPRTRKIVDSVNRKFDGNISMVEPLGYFDMLWLLKNSELAFTDSGGLQKEAYWLKVPCITLRDETEWVETVQSGWNILYRNYTGAHTPSDSDALLYGDGKSSLRIVHILRTAVKEKT